MAAWVEMALELEVVAYSACYLVSLLRSLAFFTGFFQWFDLCLGLLCSLGPPYLLGGPRRRLGSPFASCQDF